MRSFQRKPCMEDDPYDDPILEALSAVSGSCKGCLQTYDVHSISRGVCYGCGPIRGMVKVGTPNEEIIVAVQERKWSQWHRTASDAKIIEVIERFKAMDASPTV